ncbi:TetR/AcrR family transcriptional regulator [Nocardioides campestrisoli]|uniref:TetR/AcrR family transcriptional regulator n=1 Tax=Nocardioides campestrisoli TaxID=2736757 RepID=UPI0015E75564|nr:TetR/AcrR family transcriptional regulator [Nocardioides campestrisoli]
MPRAGLTPDRVTLGAAELADEIGFDAVTISAVARRFGVQVASLYSHVAGSRDLQQRVAVLALDEIADRGTPALAGKSGRDALAALGDAYRDYARRHPGRYAATRFPLEPDESAARAGARHAELMLAVLHGYALTGDEATHATRLLGSMIHGFIALELSGAFDHRDPRPEQSWSRALDALDGVLRGWATTPPDDPATRSEPSAHRRAHPRDETDR